MRGKVIRKCGQSVDVVWGDGSLTVQFTTAVTLVLRDLRLSIIAQLQFRIDSKSKMICYQTVFSFSCYHDLLTSISELVFTEQILQILYGKYYIAIHSLVFIFDLPTNIDVWNLNYFFLTGNCYFPFFYF
jgi:hypothetical protein